MKTIVAIASQNKKEIFEHAGKCRNFIIYTINDSKIENKSILELDKEDTLHESCSNEDIDLKAKLNDSDILLTRGVGNGLINKLAKKNIACYKVLELDPDIAIEKLIKGTLEAVATTPSSNGSGCNCSCGGEHSHN